MVRFSRPGKPCRPPTGPIISKKLLDYNEDVRDLERPEISQCFLVVTEVLYAAMDALRQAAEKDKKLKDERESLKGMMSE